MFMPAGIGGTMFRSAILVSTALRDISAQWRAGAGGNHADIMCSPIPTSA
jgi:hypothetical protein